MSAYRSFLVWGGGLVLVLGAFLIFVAAGWPGEVNACIWGDYVPTTAEKNIILQPPTHPTHAQQVLSQTTLAKIAQKNTCYCEAFSVADAVDGAPGTRQGVNTWFNLYSIGTSVTVAFFICLARRRRSPQLIESEGLIPDVYVFAVLFLGLGSMWFHGGMKEWSGITDTASMYTFAAYLVFFSIRRFWRNDVFFWIAYPITVVAYTIAGELIASATRSSLVSLFLIISLVVAYLVFELIANAVSSDSNQHWYTPFTKWRWLAAVGSILAATLFWALSQTGKPLCFPDSGFQPHGLLWHPLAGVMAVFLYFYWSMDITDGEA